MKTPTCRHCGLVSSTCCESEGDVASCVHAPGATVQSGPMRGLRKWHYGVVYADPPWAFVTYDNAKGTVPHRTEDAPYESMTYADLVSLPVNEVAAKDCVLHMWVISSHFDQAVTLANAWGFGFKSFGLNWVKTQKGDPKVPKMGMGHWFRQESEISLLFTKGKPSRVSKGVHQVILEPAREHSRKPDCAFERIEALSTGPYLEMFSRASRPGWDAMGNQTGKFDPKPLGLPAPAADTDWEDLI